MKGCRDQGRYDPDQEEDQDGGAEADRGLDSNLSFSGDIAASGVILPPVENSGVTSRRIYTGGHNFLGGQKVFLAQILRGHSDDMKSQQEHYHRFQNHVVSRKKICRLVIYRWSLNFFEQVASGSSSSSSPQKKTQGILRWLSEKKIIIFFHCQVVRVRGQASKRDEKLEMV